MPETNSKPNTEGRPTDPGQGQERTSFQTSAAGDAGLQLGSDVAMCYGIVPDLEERIASWKEHGYRVYVMTGVSWSEYQDCLYGRFDGVNHVDEAQMERSGQKISHGGDVYYMTPGVIYGKFYASESSERSMPGPRAYISRNRSSGCVPGGVWASGGNGKPITTRNGLPRTRPPMPSTGHRS